MVWGAGLPAFSYPFHKKPLILYDGGTTKQVGTYNFPVSKGMAGVYMTLEPGAIRELHWHANAAEWAYVIEGRTRITLTSPEGKVEISDVDAGGLWYFPRGWGHSIEGLGPGNAKFLLVFNDGTFSEGATFSITDWISHTPVSWVAQNLGISPEQVNRFPKKEVYISRRPAPAPWPPPNHVAWGFSHSPSPTSMRWAVRSRSQPRPAAPSGWPQRGSFQPASTWPVA